MASATETTETNAKEIAAGSPPNPAPSVRMVPLLLMMLASALLVVAGVVASLLYLAKSGRLASALASAPSAEPSAKPAVPAKTHTVPLEPLLVNLAGPDEHGYLRAAVTLRVEDAVPAKGETAAKSEEKSKDGKAGPETNAPLRDTVLDVLGRQQAAELLVPEGKERLKAALKAALLERDPELKVTDVYFTEFLVQR